MKSFLFIFIFKSKILKKVNPKQSCPLPGKEESMLKAATEDKMGNLITTSDQQKHLRKYKNVYLEIRYPSVFPHPHKRKTFAEPRKQLLSNLTLDIIRAPTKSM